MINGTDEYHSNKLRVIVKRSGIEKPSDDFTSSVMKRVHEAGELAKQQTAKSLLTSFRLWMGLSLLVAITAVVYIAINYWSALWLQDIDPLFGPVLVNLYESFSQMISAIQLSSVTVSIIGGTILLIGLEHFFRRFQSSGNRYFFY